MKVTILREKRDLLRSISGLDSTGLASIDELPVSIMLEPPIDAKDARYYGFLSKVCGQMLKIQTLYTRHN